MDANFAPYAPTRAAMDTITRFRDRGLPSPLNAKALETVGVAATMAPRTLQALRFLGLLDDDDNPTELFQRLKRASTDEYQGQLAEVVRAAYIQVFAIVDPATDGDIAIADAFRAFEPSKQREKMISLFRGLCAEAGIIEQARQRSTARRPRQEGAAQRSRARHTPPPPPPGDGGGTANFTQTDGDTYVLMLPSGPTMTLTVRMDVMRTSVADRDFIFKVVDLLREFGTEADQVSAGKQDATGDGGKETGVAA
jgi:hypothetical protein